MQRARGRAGLKARQRLEGVVAAGLHVDDRLDEDGQVLAFDEAQKRGSGAAGALIGERVAGVGGDLLAAGALGDAQGDVGGAQQGVGVVAVAGKRGDADRGGDVGRVARQRVDDPLGERRGIRGARGDAELVAAQAADERLLAGLLLRSAPTRARS